MPNQTRQEYIDAIKKAAIATGKSGLIKVLLIKAPFLFYPVIGPITELLLGKILEILINETEFAAFFLYMDVRISKQGKEFAEAAVNNYKVQQTGTDQEKKDAEKLLMEKFKPLIVING